LLLQKQKLKDLIDVSAIQQRLKSVETEKGRLKYELEAERKSREETEGPFRWILLSVVRCYVLGQCFCLFSV